MSVAACIGGSAKKLVDQRYQRPLSDRERGRLEEHLSVCAVCSERYRRLQLADRVAAHGPELGLSEPSPLELERIAFDLGLLAPPPPRFWAWWQRHGLGRLGLAVALTAGLFVAFLLPRPPETLVERGGAAERLSFSVYVLAPDGTIRAHDPAQAVAASAHLKLRVAASAPVTLGSVQAVFLDSAAQVQTATLAAPSPISAPVSVVGALGLSQLTPGPVTLYLVAGPAPLARPILEAALVARPSAAEAEARLGPVVVERHELLLRPEP